MMILAIEVFSLSSPLDLLFRPGWTNIESMVLKNGGRTFPSSSGYCSLASVI